MITDLSTYPLVRTTIKSTYEQGRQIRGRGEEGGGPLLLYFEENCPFLKCVLPDSLQKLRASNSFSDPVFNMNQQQKRFPTVYGMIIFGEFCFIH